MCLARKETTYIPTGYKCMHIRVMQKVRALSAPVGTPIIFQSYLSRLTSGGHPFRMAARVRRIQPSCGIPYYPPLQSIKASRMWLTNISKFNSRQAAFLCRAYFQQSATINYKTAGIRQPGYTSLRSVNPKDYFLLAKG